MFWLRALGNDTVGSLQSPADQEAVRSAQFRTLAVALGIDVGGGSRQRSKRRLGCGLPRGRLGDIRKAWNRACQAAGVSGRLFHDMRRSAARNAIRAGVPEQVVVELGGWRTRSVLARYNVVSENDLAQALEQVTAYVSARATTECPKATTPPRAPPLSRPGRPISPR